MIRTLVNLEPTHELRGFEDMLDRLLGQPTRPTPGASTLPIDVIEREGALLIKAAVPGVDPKDLQITIENNVLSIRGEARNESETDKDKVYRREVAYGAFSRSIRLPDNLNLGEVQADFTHGMVTVRIPRQPENKPQVLRIPVRNSTEVASEPQSAVSESSSSN